MSVEDNLFGDISDALGRPLQKLSASLYATVSGVKLARDDVITVRQRGGVAIVLAEVFVRCDDGLLMVVGRLCTELSRTRTSCVCRAEKASLRIYTSR